jgi:hypothetical protein
MNRVESIWTAYRRMPTTVQWTIAAAVSAVLFLVWNDFVVRMTDDWDLRSERMLANVERASGDSQRLQSLRRLRPVVLGLGPLDAPGSESDAEKRFNMTINEILKQHTVLDDSFSYRGPSKLRRGTLSKVIAPGQQVEHITGDLRFDATPENAAKVIAALEASADIDAISSLRMTRQPGPRRVTVVLTVEAWIVSTERRGRGRGSAR